jgi:hypothetical protein
MSAPGASRHFAPQYDREPRETVGNIVYDPVADE